MSPDPPTAGGSARPRRFPRGNTRRTRMPAETDETGVVENVEPTGDESSSVADETESTGAGADVPGRTRPRVLAGLLVAVVLAAATAVLLGAHVGRDPPPAEST